MHYHLEIVMPPVDDIVSSIAQIMGPFSENEDDNAHPFWDFYVIGGRFAGNKLLATLDKEKVKEFWDWMEHEKITVSGFTCGKQTLQPDSQIPKVDWKWTQMFSPNKFQACPFFSHSNDQYGDNDNGTIEGDITTLANTPLSLECERVIICGPRFNLETDKFDSPTLEAKFMISESFWNGVTHVKSNWDTNIHSAIKMRQERLENYKEEFVRSNSPASDWLVVTVDYHT